MPYFNSMSGTSEVLQTKTRHSIQTKSFLIRMKKLSTFHIFEHGKSHPKRRKYVACLCPTRKLIIFGRPAIPLTARQHWTAQPRTQNMKQ